LGRLPALLLVLGLLGGTAAAFAVTEGLKLQKSPILETKVSKVFSPVCRCRTQRAEITFRLREHDQMTLSIEDAAGRSVRVLVDGRATPAGLHTYSWDGRLDDGRRAPDGAYRPQVELADADRVIRLPNRIVLDTRPPTVRALGVRIGPRLVLVRYRVDEPARGLLLVGGHTVVRTHRVLLQATLQVSRAFLRRARLAGPLALSAEDLAGNVAAPVPLRRSLPKAGG